MTTKAQERAVEGLFFYLNRACGGDLDNDNRSEIEDIIADIIAAAQEE